MSTVETLHVEVNEGVLRLILDRPKANALNLELVEALLSAFKQANREDRVRCVLLGGSGNVFSAGQDLRELQQVGGVSLREHLLHTYNPLIQQVRRLEKPVLAAINGPAAGAGLGLALACDLRIASEAARFVVGFLGIGLVPDSAVSLLLPALIGLGRAQEYAFTNTPILAEQALAWGLVNRLAPEAELTDRAWQWAVELANGPVRAMGLAKRAFNKAALGNLDEVLDYEAHLQEVAGKRMEHQEGVQAFLEKRPARFPR